MEIYVDEIPKSCEDCALCQHGHLKHFKNGRYVEAKGCVLGAFYKYVRMDDEIDTCPLKQIPTDNKWKKLKEWLNNGNFAYPMPIFSGDVLNVIKKKIQELEKGDKND